LYDIQVFIYYFFFFIGLIIHLLSNTKKRELHPLVLFLVLRHNDIDYDLNLDDLPVEKWTYLMSAFYQRFPEILCDPVIVRNMKKKINTYKMLIDSPQWFNENKDIFMGLHLIEFGEFKLIFYSILFKIHFKSTNIL